MAGPILAIDLYSGNYDPVNFHLPFEEMRAHGFRLAIVKASMGGGVDGIDQGKKGFLDTPSIYRDLFRAGGLDFGLYHWVDPIRAASYQWQWFRDQIGRLDPDCLAFDWEQYWRDWGEYWKAVNHQMSWGDVGKLQPAIVANCAAQLIDLADAYRKPNVPVELYTWGTFARDYAGGEWPKVIADRTKNPWLSCYPMFADSYLLLETWAEFDEFLDRYILDRSPITLANAPRSGVTGWRWWQFASTIRLPGASGRVDLSIFNGTEDEYNAWLGRPPAPPAPTFTPTPAQTFDQLKDHLPPDSYIGAYARSGGK